MILLALILNPLARRRRKREAAAAEASVMSERSDENNVTITNTHSAPETTPQRTAGVV